PESPGPKGVRAQTAVRFAANRDETLKPPPYIVPPDTGISTQVYPADQMADGMAALNSQLCPSRTAFSPSPTQADRETLDLLRLGFRHIRDGVNVCYNEAAHDDWMAREYAAEGLDAIVVGGFIWYPASQLASFAASYPWVAAIEYSNESDDARYTTSGIIRTYDPAGVTQAGSRTLSCQYLWSGARSGQCAKFLVPGAVYKLNDGARSEFVVPAGIAQQTSVSSLVLTGPTRFAHPSGTQFLRWDAATNSLADYTFEALPWYKYVAPALRAALPSMPILGPSLARPIPNAYAFAADGNGWPGAGIDYVETHSYPVPASVNPEGVTGDWYQGTGPSRPPCAYGSPSYGQMTLARCAGNQVMGPGFENATDWQTEYSAEVVPVSCPAPVGATSAIPDDVAVDYMAAGEVGALAHGATRTYWFRDQDGTDGAKSAFCTYGLIRTDACGVTYAGAPYYKPEALTLLALVNWFTDKRCHYTISPGRRSCTFTPSALDGTWSNPALPLNSQAVQWANGTIAVAFWQGAQSYRVKSAGSPCAAAMSCRIAVPTQRERYASPLLSGATGVGLTGIDDDASDPTPAPASTTAADGSPITESTCPEGPAKKPMFGCLLPIVPLSVAGGAVSVTSSRRMQFIVFTPSRAPATLAALVPGYRQLPLAAPGAPPTPEPAPTPVPAQLGRGSVSYVQSASTIAAPFTIELPARPSAGTLILGGAGYMNGQNPAPPAGFANLDAPHSGYSNALATWYAVGPTRQPIAIANATGLGSGFAEEFANVDARAPIAAHGAYASVQKNPASVTPPAVNVTRSGSAVLVVIETANGTGTGGFDSPIVPPAGWALDQAALGRAHATFVFRDLFAQKGGQSFAPPAFQLESNAHDYTLMTTIVVQPPLAGAADAESGR
ncbi:MAG: hypothetical protein ACLPYS_15315, partial [Vulcanimicrobiaceae bacterium]